VCGDRYATNANGIPLLDGSIDLCRRELQLERGLLPGVVATFDEWLVAFADDKLGSALMA
jgi:hypothetical protein